jgi:hypothetical protein
MYTKNNQSPLTHNAGTRPKADQIQHYMLYVHNDNIYNDIPKRMEF